MEYRRHAAAENLSDTSKIMQNMYGNCTKKYLLTFGGVLSVARINYYSYFCNSFNPYKYE